MGYIKTEVINKEKEMKNIPIRDFWKIQKKHQTSTIECKDV